ncbi:hypothetical protein BT63DRAFT_477256 [Microthyrium microscopicum]|uniref:Concanavalin A-like lectin/glucanase n=1 Tax=Microthyrium microscopicum TaxID=703497 RepID=A0A6A6UM13_9PEZI|nr:hypothetical protein BT63DRAFT_477256 [Microthyrium microscopicum]
MLPTISIALALVATASCQGYWQHGPTFGWRGRSGSGKAHIVKAETTLWPGEPPALPKTSSGRYESARVALWPGLDSAKGILIQPIIVATQPGEYAGCSGEGRWCVFASYLQSTQRMGRTASMSPNDSLTMKFEYKPEVDGYDQQLFLAGKMVSQITSKSSGKSQSFYTDVECQQQVHSRSVNEHKYTNTVITLSEADPSWGKKPSNHFMACADSITTPDNGLTWNIPTITVSKSQAPSHYTAGSHPPGPIICPS